MGVVETEMVGVESRDRLDVEWKEEVGAGFGERSVSFFLGGIDAVRVPPEVGIDMDDFPVFRCVSMACCFLRALASSGSSVSMLSSSSTGSSSALDWSKSESTISSSSIVLVEQKQNSAGALVGRS